VYHRNCSISGKRLPVIAMPPGDCYAIVSRAYRQPLHEPDAAWMRALTNQSGNQPTA
jgi:hypothetical protein